MSLDDLRILSLRGIVVDTVLHTTEPYTESILAFGQDRVVQQLRLWLPEYDISFIQEHCRLMHRAGHMPEDKLGTLLDNYFQLKGYQGPYFSKYKTFIGSMGFSSLANNAVVITRTGYKGFVLGEPKMGDSVFVAYGCRLPLIVRRVEPDEGSYTLVGCACIDGLMDGEALQLKEAGKLTEQFICLV
jgi:hypothetical protein